MHPVGAWSKKGLAHMYVLSLIHTGHLAYLSASVKVHVKLVLLMAEGQNSPTAYALSSPCHALQTSWPKKYARLSARMPSTANF